MRFKTAPEYAHLYRGAHKRPATMVGAPALVCHLGLWGPSGSRNDWKQELDAFVRMMLDKLSTPDHDLCLFDHASIPTDSKQSETVDLFGGKVTLAGRSYRYEPFGKASANQEACDETGASADPDHVVSLAFYWRGIRCVVRCELQLEYFLITMFMDLSVKPRPGAAELDTQKQLWTALRAILAALKKAAPPDTVVEPSPGLRAAHTQLYESIWTAFCDDLFQDAQLDHLGRVFADFRGVILGTTKNSAPSIQMPFWRSTTGISSRTYSASRTEAYWQKVIRALWPFMQATRRLPLRRYEFTVSRVLDGRGIYATALGPLPKYGYGDEDRVPLFFLVVFDGHNTWQLGRLIQTLVHLDILRIAATKDFDLLRARADALGRIEADLASQTNLLGDLLAPKNNSSPLERDKDIAAVAEQGELLRSRLAKGAWLDEYSLDFRTAQSRSYREEFVRTLRLLRLGRLEGLQPYDAFVERRLGQTFDFIQRVGSRFEKASAGVSTLFKQLQSDRTEKNFKAVVKLQAVGEVALWAALLPYYIGSILDNSLVSLAVSIANSGCNGHVGRLEIILRILTWFTVALIGWRMAIDRFRALMPELYNGPNYRLLRKVHRLLSPGRTVRWFKLWPLLLGAVMVGLWLGLSYSPQIDLCEFFEVPPGSPTSSH